MLPEKKTLAVTLAGRLLDVVYDAQCLLRMAASRVFRVFPYTFSGVLASALGTEKGNCQLLRRPEQFQLLRN